MSSKKKEKRKRKYSSSSSGSDSSSSSSSSSSSGSSSSSSRSSPDPSKAPGVPKSSAPSSASLDCVSAMFLDTKPDELIDQIFIILDDADIKDLCPTILRHMSIPDLKEKALNCISSLDEAGLEALYTNQEVDPGAEEIDKALLQLGLVGNSTALLERDTNKWKTLPEEPDPAAEETAEAAVAETEEDGLDGAIFSETVTEESKERDLPKRKRLADTPADSADDAETWRALLMKDKERMSMKLDTTDVIASNLSDKPIDFVPEETPIRRRNDEAPSPRSRPLTPLGSSSSREDSPAVIGNPPLAIGNPPLAEDPDKPRLSYRQRAAAAAAAEEDDEDKISAADITSGSDSESESSSSEEGEISDDEEEEKEKEEGKKEEEDKEEEGVVKSEPGSPSSQSHPPQKLSASNSPLRNSSTSTPKQSNSPRQGSSEPRQGVESETKPSTSELDKSGIKNEVEEDETVSELYAL